MKIGYERVSTPTGRAARKTTEQGLSDAIEFYRKNGSLVVWKLDRLGRSLKHLIETINQLHSKSVGFVSVQ